MGHPTLPAPCGAESAKGSPASGAWEECLILLLTAPLRDTQGLWRHWRGNVTGDTPKPGGLRALVASAPEPGVGVPLRQGLSEPGHTAPLPAGQGIFDGRW